MSKNKFSQNFKSTLTLEGWNNLCSPMSYVVLSEVVARQHGIIPNNLRNLNCVVVGASGSLDNGIMYFANYMRVDHSEIDQDPYIEYYESGSLEPTIYGTFHHADFQGRTETLSQLDIQKISTSGSTTDIQFTAKPDNNYGSLYELREQGKIVGFDYAYSRALNKK
jgi:hypothetical protein